MQDDVTVYYITGRQVGPLSVPESWCEECDLTVRAVRSALEDVDPESRLVFVARPWIRHAIPSLMKGGWHPPIVVIGGRVHSQGVVPEREGLVIRLREVLWVREGEPAPLAWR